MGKEKILGLILLTFGILQSGNTLMAASACCEGESAFAPQSRPFDEGGSVKLTPQEVHNLGIQTSAVRHGRMDNMLSLPGHLKALPELEGYVSSRVPGRIVEILVKEGESVEQGQPIVVLETRQPGNPPPQVKLTAPLSGTLVQLDARVGQPVDVENTLAHIVDFSELYGVVNVLGSQVALLKPGQTAWVRSDVDPNCEYEAVLERIGDIGELSMNAMPAWFSIKNAKQHLRPGMRALFFIVIEERESNPLIVPEEAVVGTHGRRYVYVSDATNKDVYHRIPVFVTGRGKGMVSVEGDLQHGDQVVVQGAYSLQFAGALAKAGIIRDAAEAAHGHSHAGHDHDHEHEDDHDHGHDDDKGLSLQNQLYLVYALGGSTLFLLTVLIVQCVWRKKND